MGLLAPSVSITRYKVDGKISEPLVETIASALKKYSINDIDSESSDKMTGWTSFENPFQPDFTVSSFVIGTHLVFSLRIDKKTIPAKVVQKHCALEAAKRLKESGREFLAKNEKKMIKEHVMNVLYLRIPATPNIYDIVWNYEDKRLWFFSNLKRANEELETLFTTSFHLTLTRLFPFSIADLTLGLSDAQRDDLAALSHTTFSN
jgi:recombination associated protein RdgC